MLGTSLQLSSPLSAQRGLSLEGSGGAGNAQGEAKQRGSGPAASKSAKPLFTHVFYIEVLLLNVVLCFNV